VRSVKFLGPAADGSLLARGSVDPGVVLAHHDAARRLRIAGVRATVLAVCAHSDLLGGCGGEEGEGGEDLEAHRG
jgi:hypothetical protein